MGRLPQRHDVAAGSAGRTAERKLLAVPASADESAKLSAKYTNQALGNMVVKRAATKTVFDFGEWQSEVATRRNPDGTTSFVTISPGIAFIEFVVGGGAQRTPTLRDAQHEYVFDGA
jgi:hypothetical protein